MSARPKLYVDIETYSRVNLKKFGAYRYAEDEEFLILMAAWRQGATGKTQVAIGESEVSEIPGLWDPDVVKVAHNAPFERICFSRLAGLPKNKFISPVSYHDTQAIAGEQGYPQTLDGLAKALKATPKDSAGTALINFFCKPDRNGNRRMPEDHPEKWEQFVAYCVQDVDTLVEVDLKLGGWPNVAERAAYWADQAINDRGIAIDVEMAELAVEAAEENRMVQELEISAMTGIANPGSGPQMLDYLRGVGLKVPNLQAETIEKLLEKDDLNDDVRRVLELRQELALVAAKKYPAALGSVCHDGRLRGTLRFFGAHTGRWAGRGVQVHNLPREQFVWVNPDTGKKEWDELAETEAILNLKLGLGADAEDLKKMVRPLFSGPFTVVDYAAIEARVVAWLAGEEWALTAFRDGRDIYVETAQRMSTAERKLDRAQGKVAVLALGYNGGINSLRVMGASGTDEELDVLVKQWRRANRKIVRLWANMQNAISDQGAVGPHLRITREGGDVKMHLPSGRAIHYHGMRWEKYVVKDPKTGRMLRKEGWRYDDPKKPGFRIGTYGGRLVENATQAVARDILAEALVRLERDGLPVVAHVHDEILVEGQHSVAKVSRIMTKVPDWGEGLPIDGAGFTTNRYRKD